VQGLVVTDTEQRPPAERPAGYDRVIWRGGYEPPLDAVDEDVWDGPGGRLVLRDGEWKLL
jgi:hypothetical protein